MIMIMHGCPTEDQEKLLGQLNADLKEILPEVTVKLFPKATPEDVREGRVGIFRLDW